MTQPVYDMTLREHADMAVAARDISRTIASPEQYKTACDYLLRIREKRKLWSSIIQPAIKSAWESYKKIKDVEKTVEEPLINAEDHILKPAILAWESTQDQTRIIEQSRIEDEMRKAEEDRRLKYAAELEKAGNKEQAQAVMDAPIETPTVIIPKDSVRGVNSRTIYSAEVFDMKALCIAAINGMVPMETVQPNMTMLNGMAKSLKDAMNAQWKQFGVRAKAEKIIAVGGR